MAKSYGKWTKYNNLKKEKGLESYLPETALLTRRTIWSFLGKYGQVFIKPSNGYGGKGVIQVSKRENDLYEIHVWYKIIMVDGRTEVYNSLKRSFSKKKRHIIQRGIPLATIEQAPFDIRVMVQRKRKSLDWKVTGKLAKVAARGFVITNACKLVLPVEEALEKSSLTIPSIANLLTEIEKMCLNATAVLHKAYKKCRKIGLDIGIDENGRPWIIEANFTPSISMFNKLEDKSMLEEIKEYQKG